MADWINKVVDDFLGLSKYLVEHCKPQGLGTNRYTPVSKRRKVEVILGVLADGPLDKVFEELSLAKMRASREDITDLNLNISDETGYYSNVDVSVTITGKREETDQEWMIRDKEEQRRSSQDQGSELLQYERLKAKFEGK